LIPAGEKGVIFGDFMGRRRVGPSFPLLAPAKDRKVFRQMGWVF
jgi:hypothetical protein